MLRSAVLIATTLLAFACSKDKTQDKPAPTQAPATDTAGSAGSGSATGSGSAAVAASGSETGSAAAAGSSDTGSAAAAGSGADAGSAAAGSAAGSGADAGSGVKFDKLSHDEQVKYMKEKVMPAMKAAFQKFDPKEFANFTCKTCHGKDPKKTKYEMPSKDLPALDFAAIKAGKEDPKVVKFMGEVVKPEMAKLLGEPEYNDQNPDGFGCLHCHTAKK